ncbi:lipase family protein [Corynebacterium sp. TAE3-ERU12]|uniref:lipase family protein n=1 Tax=Corynebacterium sp. TAE3-ERU12 TaxID=2849491 RepID=UPI001C46687A|nr:lipase family protein [Corynebacterium sp. TAE3-ERU12]MBV7294983.1 lipase family protein [Corynebacterium sp. TAE3-ERU12]
MKPSRRILALSCSVALCFAATGVAAAAPSEGGDGPWWTGSIDHAPGSDSGSTNPVGSSPAGSSDPASDPFYQPPADLPEPGALIRTQPAPHIIEKFGIDWPGVSTKILYSSVNERGQRVGVSGFIIEPTTEWEGSGPRPTVVVAPGTMGQGDQCAPSAGWGQLANIDLANSSFGFDYELLSAYTASAKGIRVVVTDYIGMGTPGVHTYVNSTDEGHAVLDAARAALEFAGDPADSPVGVVGYSQGGGASAAAAEYQPAYAPELNLVAAYAGAPPANLREVLDGIEGGSIEGVVGYALNTGRFYNPELEPLVDAYLNDEGRRFLETTKNQCIVDSVAMWGFRKSSSFTKDGRPFKALVDEIPEVGEYLDKQKLGRWKPDAKVMVQIGANDDAIPAGQARQLGRDYCALGADVSYLENDTPLLIDKTGLNHIVPLLANMPDSMDFLVAAFNGEEVGNDCGTF